MRLNLNGWRQPKGGRWQVDVATFQSPLPEPPRFARPWKWLGVAALFFVLDHFFPLSWGTMAFPLIGMTVANWPGTAALPALAARRAFNRKSLQLPWATGNGESDAPEILWGTGAPNGVIVGRLGDLYMQTDVTGGGKLLWEKRTGVDTNTGWAQSATPFFDVKDYGAIGNNIVDDLAAIQSVLDIAVPLGAMVWFSQGIYRITAGLRVGTGGATMHSGWCIAGCGAGSGAEGGAVISLEGTGHVAVLTVKKDAWRLGSIRSITLSCVTSGGATYGLLYEDSNISQIYHENLFIDQPDTAIGLLKGASGSGEFMQFINVRGSRCKTFYYSTAGQAFIPYFENCFCIFRQDGGGHIMFFLDLGSSNGGGLTAISCHMSHFGQPFADCQNNTVLKLRGINQSVITFIGGRYEIVTNIIDHDVAENAGLRSVEISFRNSEFTMDNRKGAAANTTNGAIKLTTAGNGAALQILFDVCNFERIPSFTDVVFDVVYNTFTRGRCKFRQCTFVGFAQPPYVRGAWNTAQSVEFEDCRANWTSHTGDATILSLPFDFSRHSGKSLYSDWILRRNAHLISGALSDGKAINHLQVPQFRLAAGNLSNTPADAPWAHGGTSSDLLYVRDWSANSTPGNGPRSASPWSKRVALKPTSYVYQDISSINLNVSNIASAGNNGVWVVYQALMYRINGSNQVRFALENSSSGKIYDDVIINVDQNNDEPQMITLVAIMDLTAVGSLRVKIENVTSGNLELDFGWQYVTDKPEAMFVGAGAAAVQGTTPWSAAGESLRLWSRLGLPHKLDTYGSAASPAHGDLESDLYLSSLTEHLTYFANTKWNRLARLEVGADVGDAGATLLVATSAETQRWATTLTANRTVTLSATNAYNGARFRIIRTGLGAFTLDVGGLQTIPANTAAIVDVEYDGAAWKLTNYVVIAGDVDQAVITGGFRQSLDGWFQENVAASQTDVVMTRLATTTEAPAKWIAPRAGSVTGVWVKANTPRTAGTLTIKVFKNGAQLGTLTAVLDGTNTTFKATLLAKDTITFVAGDELETTVTTDAGWLPVTADIRTGIEIET